MSCLRRHTIALILLCLVLVLATSLAQTCGERKVMNQLVVNGTDAKDGYWPWHVALFHNDGLSLVYACGGTILDHNIVLTAAHCVMTSNGVMARERLVVQVGRNRLRVGSNRVQEHEAFQLIVHPEYNVNGIRHDIALIKLATDINYTDYIQPICLWNRGEDQNAIVGSWGTVVGFGIDETGNVSNTLREANIPVVSHITCIESNRKAFAFQLTSNMFCAGNRDGIGACNGDSGGGIFFSYNYVWYIRGVVSFTKLRRNTLLCDTNEYTVFTDVAKYLKFIEPHMRVTGGQPIVGNDNGNRNQGNDIRGIVELVPISTCGPNPYADRKESLKPVLLGYPWVGLLEYTNTGYIEKETLCQATLISDLYLLTAAQCNNMPWHYTLTSVRLGEYDRNTTTDCAEVDERVVCSPAVQTLRIKSVITHPDYKLHPDYKVHRLQYDIALIRLRDRADTSQSNVKPICLPMTSELRNQMSTQYVQTAWDTFSAGNLLERSLREILDYSECQKLTKKGWKDFYVTPRHICIKQPNDFDCKWPMVGAPLQLVQQVQGKSRYVLYGMLTFQHTGCKVSVPDVFIKIANYIDWILENIRE